MSLICEFNGCRDEAMFECICDIRIVVCDNHMSNHLTECEKSFIPLKPISKQQSERKAKADKKLIKLKSMAISQAEGIIKAVREALSSFLDSIDSEKR